MIKSKEYRYIFGKGPINSMGQTIRNSLRYERLLGNYDPIADSPWPEIAVLYQVKRTRKYIIPDE
jgi:hypothetical protein